MNYVFVVLIEILGYSPSNTPHLSPALELDDAILEFSGSLQGSRLPTHVSSQKDIDTLMSALEDHLNSKELWQFYVLDVQEETAAILSALSSNSVVPWNGEDVEGKSTHAIADIVRSSGLIRGLGALSSRYCAHVDGDIAVGIMKAALVHKSDDDRALAEGWKQVVDALNVPLYAEWTEDTRIALDMIKKRLKYIRLDSNGPKLGKISKECVCAALHQMLADMVLTSSPLVEPYFTRLPGSESNPALYSVANNGWIWNADPLINFALPVSKAYLRREVIAWGDCVKLRYGSSPSDNPWLWEFITSYVISLAKSFDGFRIDNCHSTPLHVGTAMLDTARKVNPNLYVCAELFTGSEEMDLLFVRKLGINSLVREAGNAWDAKEFSRIMYRYGLGKPLGMFSTLPRAQIDGLDLCSFIGSMDEACLTSVQELAPPFSTGPTRPCIVTHLHGSVPHAIMYDLTHDNESYLDKFTAEHALCAAGVVTFGYCAVASVKGFDDLYPKLLNLVREKRLYEVTDLGEGSGIGRAKRVLNGLRRDMVLEEYEEAHVFQDDDASAQLNLSSRRYAVLTICFVPQYIIIHRVHPRTQKGYLLVAHMAFTKRTKERGCGECFYFAVSHLKLTMAYDSETHRNEPNPRKVYLRLRYRFPIV